MRARDGEGRMRARDRGRGERERGSVIPHACFSIQ